MLVRAPATVANLGPGFDALALALDLWNEVEADTEARPEVRVEGEGAGELPEDASNLVFRAMVWLAREVGGTLPPFALRCRNRIPLERGLGSSAAAVVSGIALAVLALTQRPELLPEAVEDRLHQSRRLPLVPGARALFEELRAAGLPVCVAGAGPSLVAFETEDRRGLPPRAGGGGV